MKRNTETLRDYFGGIFDAVGKDPVEHIVVLTYEFDDQQMLNLSALEHMGRTFEPRISHLASIAKLVPIVLYDARKTREAMRLPHFMELLPVRTAAYSCHHAKAYLIVTRDHVHLALGSMNFTASGLFANREVFDTFRWSGKELQDRPVLADFLAVLRSETCSAFASAPLEAVIAKLDERLSAWQGRPDAGDARLLHQGYDDKTGLESLRARWRAAYGDDAEPDRVIVVSPFFDRDIAAHTVSEDLARAFPRLAAIDVITDSIVANYLCQRHFNGVGRRRLFLIPDQISDEERQHIAQANQTFDISDHVITRKLHAKILILMRGSDALVYLGSGNFTRKAWTGGNHELGFTRTMCADPDALLAQLQRNLGAAATDRYADLPAQHPAETPPDDDDDAYVDGAGYPDCVLGIELCASDDPEKMHFVIRTAEGRQEELSHYRILWGKFPLSVKAGRSQPLQRAELASCLLGGRNLCFRPLSDPATVFYLPFRHSAALFEQRELFIYPRAEDWMLQQLGVERMPDRDLGEYLPGDAPPADEDPALAAHAQREENPVIRMQRYLSLFASIEATFRKRANTCRKGPAAEIDQRWRDEITQPLAAFADVIAQEADGDGLTRDAIFKLGELALFTRRLMDIDGRAGTSTANMRKRLPRRHRDPVVNEYLTFCHAQIR
ncbi:hypothetical protein LMG23992_02247 [Cupriavidus laharis]|uniref:PLD phosphodiesterase domain-containing protein n=1 Tax=Cupriavidus laharis TaxID=151654 RepID=A0ABM8WY56_9BURK|nr:hypothetical protein [Cupriavidus laharis]CAG9172482.1 hypothetical protein LMG23992_02247 [Cupriavidus laharis]